MGVRLVKHVEALYCPPNGQTNDIRLFRDLQTIDIDELMQFAHSSEEAEYLILKVAHFRQLWLVLKQLIEWKK